MTDEARDTFAQFDSTGKHGAVGQTSRNSGKTSGSIQMFARFAVDTKARNAFTDGWFQMGGVRAGKYEQTKTNRIYSASCSFGKMIPLIHLIGYNPCCKGLP